MKRPPAPHLACQRIRWAREGGKDPFLSRKNKAPKHTEPGRGFVKAELGKNARKWMESL